MRGFQSQRLRDALLATPSRQALVMSLQTHLLESTPRPDVLGRMVCRSLRAHVPRRPRVRIRGRKPSEARVRRGREVPVAYVRRALRNRPPTARRPARHPQSRDVSAIRASSHARSTSRRLRARPGRSTVGRSTVYCHLLPQSIETNPSCDFAVSAIPANCKGLVRFVVTPYDCWGNAGAPIASDWTSPDKLR